MVSNFGDKINKNIIQINIMKEMIDLTASMECSL